MDMTVDQKAVELLKEAERLINDDGRHWIRGNFRKNLSPHADKIDWGFCAVGALYQAAGVYRDGELPAVDHKALRRACSIVASQIGLPAHASSSWGDQDVITWFNDRQAKSFKDVVKKFRAAARVLKGK